MCLIFFRNWNLYFLLKLCQFGTTQSNAAIFGTCCHVPNWTERSISKSVRAVTKVFFSVHTKCTLKVLSITLILKCFFLLTVSLSYDVDQAPFN